MTIDYIGFAYAITVATGGIVGYVKAGSYPSLGAGLVFGSLLGYGAYQITKNPSNIYLSLGTSVILAGVMGERFYRSQKLMPAGLITFISVAMILKLSYQGVSDLIATHKAQ